MKITWFDKLRKTGRTEEDTISINQRYIYVGKGRVADYLKQFPYVRIGRTQDKLILYPMDTNSGVGFTTSTLTSGAVRYGCVQLIERLNVSAGKYPAHMEEIEDKYCVVANIKNQ